MRVLTDPVGPGLVAFCGPESGDRFAADPEKHIRRYGKVLALWLRRPQASCCFHSGKLILSFDRVPDNDHRGGWGNPWRFESPLRHHRNSERDFGFSPKSLLL
jgi:hypothetical protein